jgi:hypothetical protein
LVGSFVAAAILGAASGQAFAQAQSYPQISNCLSPQNMTQRQECSIQRQPFYTSDHRTVQHPSAQDGRLEMNLDDGGGTQMPVVPNTTGAPVTSGGADGIGPSVD